MQLRSVSNSTISIRKPNFVSLIAAAASRKHSGLLKKVGFGAVIPPRADNQKFSGSQLGTKQNLLIPRKKLNSNAKNRCQRQEPMETPLIRRFGLLIQPKSTSYYSAVVKLKAVSPRPQKRKRIGYSVGIVKQTYLYSPVPPPNSLAGSPCQPPIQKSDH